MLDTIVLAINLGNEAENQKIIDPKTFDDWSPSLSGVLSKPYHRLGKNGQIHCHLNPKTDISLPSRYFPTLEFYKKHIGGGLFKNVLYVRFSITKLLFGNNIEELKDITPFDNELNDAVNWLHIALLKMGVRISIQQLMNSPVNQVHFSKNIVFEDGTTPFSIISYLQKSNIDMRKQITSSSYSGGGYGSHIATKKKGLSIYDKAEEVKRSKQASKFYFDENGISCQCDIFGDLLSSETQVLRMEMQCGSPREIRATLKAAGITISGDITLRKIYGSEISKKVLLNELDKLEQNIPSIVDGGDDISIFATRLVASNPKSTVTQRMKAIALKVLLNSNNMREARKILDATNSQWSRLIADMKKLKIDSNSHNPLAEVRRQLEEFQPIRLYKPP